MTPPHERAERELGRVLTRLAALGPSRLSRPGGSGPAPAELVRRALQDLADAAAAAEGRETVVVPVLAERALGDQLSVIGRDLLESGDDAALDAAAARLEALRRAL